MEHKNGRFGFLELPKENYTVSEEKGRDAFSHLELGEKNYYEGSFEPALREYCSALQYDKGLADAWIGQIKCLLSLEELEEAEIWVNNALGYFPRNADLLAVKAMVFCELGKTEEALTYSDDSLNYPSQTGYPWVARGNTLFFLRHEKTAIQCLEKIATENPGDLRIFVEMAKVYLRHKKYGQAVFYFDRAVQMSPDNAYLWFLMAQCYQKMRSRSMFQICCEKALEIRPDYAEVQNLKEEHHSRCFIATACYRNPSAPELNVLRAWRDQHLETCRPGRLFLDLYYRAGPGLAGIVKKTPFLRTVVRACLKHFVLFPIKAGLKNRPGKRI